MGLYGPKGKLYTGWVQKDDGNLYQYKKGRYVTTKKGQQVTKAPGADTAGGAAGTGAGGTGTSNKNLPPQVTATASQYLAKQTALEAQARQDSAARRSNFARNVIGAGSGAADIYGGRAPAIFGQALTGAQRQERVQAAQQASMQAEQERALMESYINALGEDYSEMAQQGIEQARRRSENMATINRVGP